MYYDIYMYFLIIIIILCSLLIFILSNIKKGSHMYSSDTDSISELSFQRYAKFLNETVIHDEMFNYKINKIYQLIVKNKETDIEKIADSSFCTFDECVLKIRYLKHKGKLNNYYVDTKQKEVNFCSPKDRALIRKYAPYIYYKRCAVDEIARKLPNATFNNLESLKEQILNELDYLDKKSLITGLNIDKVDNKIIYYQNYNKAKENDYISINCENCGALNDVPRNGKVRCEYCKTIIEDEKK